MCDLKNNLHNCQETRKHCCNQETENFIRTNECHLAVFQRQYFKSQIIPVDHFLDQRVEIIECVCFCLQAS